LIYGKIKVGGAAYAGSVFEIAGRWRGIVNSDDSAALLLGVCALDFDLHASGTWRFIRPPHVILDVGGTRVKELLWRIIIISENGQDSTKLIWLKSVQAGVVGRTRPAGGADLLGKPGTVFVPSVGAAGRVGVADVVLAGVVVAAAFHAFEAATAAQAVRTKCVGVEGLRGAPRRRRRRAGVVRLAACALIVQSAEAEAAIVVDLLQIAHEVL
jgi:hypothetical protein